MPSLLVLGGNGFVGRAVCKAALQKGWSVTSLARSGAPDKVPGALKDVKWVKGSALETDKLVPLVKENELIVNCIGTLVETGPHRTYEALNYGAMDSCIRAVKQSDIQRTIGYVSAATFDPLTRSLLSNYYSTKNRAEQELISWAEKTDLGTGIVFRPGLIYGWDRPATVFVSFLFRLLTLFASSLFPPPINVNRLANTIVHALEHPTTSVFEAKDL